MSEFVSFLKIQGNKIYFILIEDHSFVSQMLAVTAIHVYISSELNDFFGIDLAPTYPVTFCLEIASL